MEHPVIRSPSAHGRRVPHRTFEEALYEHLRAAPWWLASAAAHLALFAVLSLFAGGASAARAQPEGIQVGATDAPVDLDKDVVIDPPEPEEPLAYEERILPPVPDDMVPVEAPPSENPQEFPIVDLRFTPGALEGPGSNHTIGAGGDAGGGGPEGGFRSRNPLLRPPVEKKTLDATDAGLLWLMHHQSPDGRWDCDGFEALCRRNKCGGPGGALHDPGVSGLALLAFLGTGETHKSGKYGPTVRNGLKYLKAIQDAEGCFGSRASGHFTYDHAIAAMAMAEAYGLTQSPLFKASAQKGLDFVGQCRNPYLGWRYGVKPQDNDTSVTGWMVLALKSGKMAGLEVDPEAFEGAVAFLDRVTEPEYGRAGYTAKGNGPARPQELLDRFPMDRSESLTAVAACTRIFCGTRTDDPLVRKAADLCLKSLPSWDEAAGTIDHYYWYYGTLAMFQVGGEHWRRWNAAMVGSILGHQVMDTADDRYGSWEPADPWSRDGGRVYSTAVLTMCLEVYYRYGKVAGTR